MAGGGRPGSFRYTGGGPPSPARLAAGPVQANRPSLSSSAAPGYSARSTERQAGRSPGGVPGNRWPSVVLEDGPEDAGAPGPAKMPPWTFRQSASLTVCSKIPLPPVCLTGPRFSARPPSPEHKSRPPAAAMALGHGTPQGQQRHGNGLRFAQRCRSRGRDPEGGSGRSPGMPPNTQS